MVTSRGSHATIGRHRKRRLITPFLAAALLAPTTVVTAALVAAGPAGAATINAASTAADGATGSLRAAVSAANANGVDDTIVLDGGTYHLDKACGPVPEDANASGDLDHTDAHNLTIQGNGATIDIPPACNDRVIQNVAAGTLTLARVTITGGHLTPLSGDSQGGGIWSQGPLVIDHATVTGNQTTSPHAAGGGILGNGTITVTASTINANTVATTFLGGFAYGGGVYAAAALDVTNSTISGNTASSTAGGAKGGGLHAFGNLTLDHATVASNAAGTAANVFTFDAPTSRASVISGGIGSENCGFVNTPATLGYNVDSDGTCGFTGGPGDVVGVDPLLGPLADNGGTTRTMLPGAGSPLLDAIPTAACTLTSDQRGVARPTGAGCDPGAVEIALLATSAAADGATGSLRAAVNAANARAVNDTIVLDGGTYHLDTACGAPEAANVSGDLDHTDTHDLTIVGNGSTIDIPAACQDRVIENVGPATMTLTEVRITGGRLDVYEAEGGGVRSAGPLVLERATITGNHATGAFTSSGGGVFAGNGLSMSASTADANTAIGNMAFAHGGGVFVSGTASIRNSTITGNDVTGTSPTVGGGVFAYNGTLSLQFDTIVANAALTGGSNVAAYLSTPTTTGSVFALGGAYSNCSWPVPTSGGYNFDDGTTCGLGGTGDTSNGGNPNVLALADNGGPTRTRLPGAASPLVDSVPAGSCPTNDQRGIARPQNSVCDKGSVEVSGGDRPAAPTDVTAFAGNARATVSWLKPDTEGASPVTSYQVVASPGGATQVLPPAGPALNTAVFTGLTPGVSYTFTVRAANAVGYGPSAASNPVVPYTLPGAPTIGTAVAGNAQATVTWSPPTSDGGSPITSYVVTSSPDGKTCTWSSGPLSCVVPGLTNGTTYTFTVTAANAAGPGPASGESNSVVPSAPGSGSFFHPLAPVRILDSRGSNGGWNGTLAAGTPRTLQVTGTNGVPANADAIVVNVTVTGGSHNSFVTAYPAGGTVPTASNVNFAVGQTIPNLVTVKIGTGGQIAFANEVGSVHVIADLVGYYSVATADRFHALAPTRILDSRGANGGWNGTLAAGTPRTLQVANANGIPATADAVIMNVTVTGSSNNSFVTAYPAGTTRPNASNVNFAVGETIPNLVTVKLGTGGQVAFANEVGSVHVIADVVGYYDATGGDLFHALPPARILDSRGSNGGWNAKLQAGTPKALQVTGAGGVPPAATAVIGNTTVTNGTANSFVTVYPAGTTTPNASNVNFAAGQTIPNLTAVKVNGTGKIAFANEVGATDVIFDVVGYFAPT